MKRSEMLEVIANELERIGANPEITDIWASSILFKIEDAGMLPELNLEGKELGWESSYNQVIEYCKWEPENEKK